MYPSLSVRNCVLSRAKQFKYLGSLITEKNKMVKEISARILAGSRAFYVLAKLLGSKPLSTELNVQLCTTLFRPVMTHGAVTWPLRKEDERMLIVWERKVLRKIYGPMKDEWRIRIKNE